MPKIKIPKSVQKSLGLRKNKIDLEDLLGVILKAILVMAKGWLTGGGKPEERETAVPSQQSRTAVSQPANATQSEHLAQAETYRQGIHRLATNAATELQKDRLTQLAQEMDDWITAVERLETKIQTFRQNKLVQEDLRRVPKAIRKLEKQLEDAKSDAVRTELSRTLATRRTQLDKLEQVKGNMQAAELKIEGTLAQMGTIYSQALLAQSEGKLRTFDRLVTQVDEEVLELQDYLDAMAEMRTN